MRPGMQKYGMHTRGQTNRWQKASMKRSAEKGIGEKMDGGQFEIDTEDA